ncbi:MAG TPA: CocE/NonD family hydrolase [Planctomycetota bacterium]|jgi:hypothetical protein|nr:CocE/NonD family hydrolase [Planctomycetota bacterium]
MNLPRRALAPFVLLLAPAGLRGQGADWVRANYTKHEYEIPMRDGVKLFTAVYVPKDDARTYPILLQRTPYSVSPYGVDRVRESLGPSELFAKEGFIFAYQDVRGRYRSGGEFVHVRPYRPGKRGTQVDESSDAYDTIEWLLRHVPGHNGRVGVSGISYPGFYAAMAAIDAHPAVKAVSPQAPVCDWFVGDDFRHNGALFLPHAFNFLVSFERQPRGPTTRRAPSFEHGTEDGYRFFLRLGPLSNAKARYFSDTVPFWDEMLAHPDDDDFWKARDTRPHLKEIRPAVLTVGGWFDAEDLFGALATYQAIERQSPGAENRLVMGPWPHGGWSRSDGDSLGDVRFGSKTAVFYREGIEFPFFLRHLKEKGEPALPEAYVFETGTNRWRKFETWPPREARPLPLFLRGGGTLSREAPTEKEAQDEFPSDPGKPVPYTDKVAIGMTREYMLGDQRFAASRPDVLAFETEPLPEDLFVAGPVRASLVVSTSGTDADWVVKLIDVYPDDFPNPDPNPKGLEMGGFQQLVRGEPFRGRYRNGFDRPEPFRPGEAAKVEFAMPDVCHAFRRGHRIMVQVQSSWFPLVDRNPQTFVEIAKAKEEDFQKATHRVFRSAGLPSLVTLGVLEGAAEAAEAAPTDAAMPRRTR